MNPLILIVYLSVSCVLTKESVWESDIETDRDQAPRTTLSDADIVALIKKELNDRTHFHFDSKKYDEEEILSTEPSESVDFDMSSTELSSTDDDEFDIFSTDISNPEIQKRYESKSDIVEAAWNRFGDDIPSILKTMNKLNKAINSLDDDYEEYGDDITYKQMIEDIEITMKELLESYKDIYKETNELIQIIKAVYMIDIDYNDNLRKLLSLTELIYDEDGDSFGDDIDGIKITMQRLRDSIDELSDFDIPDEYKTILSDKMIALLDNYNDVIANTNKLIELINMFSLMIQNK